MEREKRVILLAGPTASGKSKLAIKLAQYFNGEIINADSMQIYKEISILNSKPSSENIKVIKHHLYGFNSVKKNFSTGHWLEMVIKKIEQLWKNGRTPIVVGGTGLYFKVLTDGLVKIPNIPIKFRNKIRNLQKKMGQRKFFLQLIKLDPLINEKINSTDVQRSIRAYEVKSFTKESLVNWFKNTKSKYTDEDFIKFYIDFPRKDLLEKISIRVDKMFKEGVIEEVKKFLKIKPRKDNSANKMIGINEIKDFLNKKYDLKETREKITIKTRQYAKRQSTWARGKMMNWQKVNPKDLKNILKKI